MPAVTELGKMGSSRELSEGIWPWGHLGPLDLRGDSSVFYCPTLRPPDGSPGTLVRISTTNSTDAHVEVASAPQTLTCHFFGALCFLRLGLLFLGFLFGDQGDFLVMEA